jgi:dihydrofolate reductase
VACNSDGIIGLNNSIPWKCSEDMKHFKNVTTGKIVIMGRKTYESIGKPLPNRHSIVITTQSKARDSTGNLTFVGSLEEAYTTAYNLEGFDKSKVFIIGGADIYWQSRNHVVEIYLSKIRTDKFSMRGNVVVYPLSNLKNFDLMKTNRISDKCTVHVLRRKGIN